MTGDELYTYLQRSSLINDRYLLVEELPELFECFNRSYQFHANESLASVILDDHGLDYAEFNALPLHEALQVALTDTDGCFVCFGGNTLLIGKLESGFFSFDPHSRSSCGMLSMFGKSTRVLFQNIDEVYSHLQDLAHSMRYSQSIECNLTGVYCKMNSIFNVSNLLKEEKDIAKEKSNATIESGDGEDDLVFIRQEQLQFCFTPLNAVFKKDVCQKLNIPYIYNENSSDFQSSKTNMTRPRLEKKNCRGWKLFF